MAESNCADCTLCANTMKNQNRLPVAFGVGTLTGVRVGKGI